MKKIYTSITALVLFLYSAGTAYAAEPPRIDQIGGILDSVFSKVVPIGGLLAVGMIVFGGYMWMISEGDPGKIKQAQGTLTWAIAGLIFLVIFGIVLKSVFDFLGN